MAVKLMVDSASDIGLEEAKALDVVLMSLSVQFGDERYLDGVDLNSQAFFEKLIERDELPVTSQITPFQFEEQFQALTADGSSVVVITLSEKLSGTYASAVQAARDFPTVHVVDSQNVSIGERLLLRYALRLRRKDWSAEAIAAELERVKGRIRLMALLDTLEYLQKGGRISAVTAGVGTVLNIKPVISVVDGAVKLAGKAMGSKKGNNLLMQLVQKSGGIDFSMPYAAAYSGLDDSLLQKYLWDSAELWRGEMDAVPAYCIGSTIGTHAGPGAIGVAFFAPEREV